MPVDIEPRGNASNRLQCPRVAALCVPAYTSISVLTFIRITGVSHFISDLPSLRNSDVSSRREDDEQEI